MLYYVEMIQTWCGEIEAEDEDDALEIADMYFCQQEVNSFIEELKEDEKK